MGLFGPKKPDEDARVTIKADQFSVLNHLVEVLDWIEQATEYGTPEPNVGKITEQTQETIEYMPTPIETNEQFKEAFEQLCLLKSEVNDRPLGDMLEHYTKALTRKNHAWLWQQNYRDASFQDKNRIWLDLEEADKEAAILREYLKERIEQLVHCQS
jgi:hypothetical protein